MNRTIIIGRLTQDPTKYSTTSGQTYCKFTVAVNREYGEEKKADFINCTCFSKQAEHILRYLSKGSLVAVAGRLQTNKYYDDRSQKNIYTTDVITDNVQFLDSKKKETSALTGELPNQNINPENSKDPFGEFGEMSYNTEVQNQFEINDDDLPW